MTNRPHSYRQAAKRVLAKFFASNRIGTYRRIGSVSWRIKLPDDELVLDDEEVLQILESRTDDIELLREAEVSS
ncbi:MAG: hypothetical protein ACOCTG_05115 [Bacteroidota bacterium]